MAELVVKYNGVKLNDYFIISNPSRPLPEFRDESTEVEGADGESFDGLTIGVREFSFELIAKRKTAKNVQRAARKLMSVFMVRKPKAFTFSDEKDGENIQLVRYAIPSGSFDVEEFIRAGRWTCRFKQPDPYLYGKRSEATLYPSNLRDRNKVKVGGNVPTWPEVIVDALSGNRYRISNSQFDSDGKHVKFDATFTASSRLVLDFEKHKATLTPSQSTGGLVLGSRFFQLEPGSTMLYVTHKTKVSWRDRWL